MGVPTNPVMIENRREGGYVVWDSSDGMLTREAIILLAASGVCIAGLVLGALLTGAVGVATALGTNTGNGAFSAIATTNGIMRGVYTVEFDDPTHFIVNDPTGVQIGHGTTGQAFAANGLGFTITAGATAFVAGDSFNVAVTGGTIKYVPYDPTAVDGRQNAAAILWSGFRDATLTDKRAVANVRGPMKVQTAELMWGANVTTDLQRATAMAQLGKLGILSV